LKREEMKKRKNENKNIKNDSLFVNQKNPKRKKKNKIIFDLIKLE